jgi:hypothetical protein
MAAPSARGRLFLLSKTFPKFYTIYKTLGKLFLIRVPFLHQTPQRLPSSPGNGANAASR